MPFAPDTSYKEITVPITRFLNNIGIKTIAGDIIDETFVPGIEVRNGTLVYEQAKLKYPGDLLHEAGHLAVMTPDERAKANATIDTGGGEELAAIAWSYAAALYIGIEPDVVFHPDGYKGDSQMILENFAAGRYFGIPLLEWMGMTADDKKAAELNIEPYPKMAKWLRDW
jgi:hypothetical protein